MHNKTNTQDKDYDNKKDRLKEIASTHPYETALALCSIRLAVIIVTFVTLIAIG